VQCCTFVNICCRTSVRQIAIYDAADPSSAVHKIDLNTCPSILIPYYDEDSSVLFITGRASTSVLVVVMLVHVQTNQSRSFFEVIVSSTDLSICLRVFPAVCSCKPVDVY